MTARSKGVVRVDVDSTILDIRRQKVMLDSDLAEAYGVTTKALNQAVKRNQERFPADFVFRLTDAERESLKSQIVTTKGRGGRRTPPWAFTEHGAIMAATVLNSPQAVEMSVFVVRAFIRLRQFARSHTGIMKRLDALEQKAAGHDDALQQMFAALRALLVHPEKQRRGIGFKSGEGES